MFAVDGRRMITFFHIKWFEQDTRMFKHNVTRLFDQRFDRCLIIGAMKRKRKAYVIKLSRRRRINGSCIHFTDFMNATN